MRVSIAWLREILPLEKGPGEIADALTARGLPVDTVEPAGADWVLDIDVPANRPDALGHLGVAREVAAAFGATLSAPPPAVARAGAPASDAVKVRIDDPRLCRRYVAGVVRGVRVSHSPGWVVERLASCGLRSVNNVVDISNLVMLELGQPIHFFDLATLSGPEIRVRPARPGETLVTLDGIERRLDETHLVIADAERAVALAGVMGGADTEITDRTTDVLVEAAWFDPAAVRAAARGLGIVTDASQRFERGCDPEAPPRAQELAARLLAKLASGVPAPGLLDVVAVATALRRASVRLSRTETLLGFPVAPGEALAALGAVGLSPSVAGDDRIDVEVPSWRVDLEREVDLVEEIGRHLGYDRVPVRLPVGLPSLPISPAPPLEEGARDRLAALGFHEAVCYAMIAAGEDDPFVPGDASPALRLTNPIAEGLSCLRRSLLPGLLRAASRNLRRGVEQVRLFEVGRVFVGEPDGRLPDEPLRAGFAWAGAAETTHWSRPTRGVDLYDAAGIVEALLRDSRLAVEWVRESGSLPGLHPGKNIVWRVGGRPVAWCGMLHPELAASLDIPAPILLGEVDLGELVRLPRAPSSVRPVPRVPSVRRDLSVVLDAGARASDLLDRLRAVPSPERVEIEVIDRYVGPPLASAESALTVRVILHPLDRTLAEETIEGYRSELVAAVTRSAGFRMRE